MDARILQNHDAVDRAELNGDPMTPDVMPIKPMPHDEQCELTQFPGAEYVCHNSRRSVGSYTIENTAEYWDRLPSPTDLTFDVVRHKPICTCKVKRALIAANTVKK